ncbi:hypothetical protein MWN63_04810 [Paradonghicola geojensis]|nr:hypothetical protein [Marivivens geojensis]
MNKKIHEVKITITEDQKQRLRDLSDITGLSIPDIFRWNTFGPGSTLRVPNQKIMGKWLYEINSIGTNLNQAQKLANERNRSGELNHDDFRRLRASIVKTRKSIDEMTAVITKEIKGDH